MDKKSMGIPVFGKEYAIVYDFLYQIKDYEKECDFLETIFRKQGKKVNRVLDLGCGTGRHAIILARRGYKMSGVDRSVEMLAIAKEKARETRIKIDFYESTIQNLNLNKTFDAVISMFDVMSYQTSNKDLSLLCKTAKQHLKSGGAFIFDAWNGLAVMTDPPTRRVKEVSNGDERIIRITEPNINIISHTVDTTFKVLKLKGDKLVSETLETHKMRFLFPQEIKYFLEVAGFSDIAFYPFLKPEDKLSTQDWTMTVIAK